MPTKDLKLIQNPNKTYNLAYVISTKVCSFVYVFTSKSLNHVWKTYITYTNKWERWKMNDEKMRDKTLWRQATFYQTSMGRNRHNNNFSNRYKIFHCVQWLTLLVHTGNIKLNQGFNIINHASYGHSIISTKSINFGYWVITGPKYKAFSLCFTELKFCGLLFNGQF